jgi:hypothetical protein
MVAKPTGDDVAFLLVLAAILLAGAVAAVRRTRAIDAAPATA